jgi:hypothetical protein
MASRDAQASLRLPADLKAAIQRIANAEQRTLSSTIELLLKRAVTNYESHGLLNSTELSRTPDDWLDELTEKVWLRLIKTKFHGE